MSNIETRDNLSFWSILDKSIVVPQVRDTTKDVSLYPSEASVRIMHNGELITLGGCIRKQWLRNKLQRLERDKDHKPDDLTIVSSDHDASTMWKFGVATLAEHLLAAEAKRAGILVEQSKGFEWQLPWEDKTTDPPLIRGEVDLVVDLCLPKPVGIEVKSFAGYHAGKALLDRTVYGRLIKGEPKEGQLLQAVLYAYYFCILLQEMDHFRLVYVSREDGSRTEFTLGFRKETVAIIQKDGSIINQERHRLLIDNEVYKYKLYAEDIIDRYLELHTYIVNDIIPPRDYDIRYNMAKLKKLAAAGELTKAQKALIDKGKIIKKGDWQCNYCNFSEMCYSYNAYQDEYKIIDYPAQKCVSIQSTESSSGSQKTTNSSLPRENFSPIIPGDSLF